MDNFSLRERLNNTNIIDNGGNIAVGLKFGDERNESLSFSSNSTLEVLLATCVFNIVCMVLICSK